MIKFLKLTDPLSVTEKHPEGVKKDYPIRVSYYALKKLKEKLGRGLTITDDGTDYEAYETLLFYALEKGHQKLHMFDNAPFPFKIDQMEDVMDEAYNAFMKIVPEFFTDEVIEPEKKGKGDGKK